MQRFNRMATKVATMALVGMAAILGGSEQKAEVTEDQSSEINRLDYRTFGDYFIDRDGPFIPTYE